MLVNPTSMLCIKNVFFWFINYLGVSVDVQSMSPPCFGTDGILLILPSGGNGSEYTFMVCASEREKGMLTQYVLAPGGR